MRLRTRKVSVVGLLLFSLACYWLSRRKHHEERYAFGKPTEEHATPPNDNRSRNLSAGNIPERSNDTCQPNPCLNDGSCEQRHHRRICTCKEEYIGRYCEEVLDEPHKTREALWISAVNASKTKPKQKRLPNVIGIGVEKCGTDALVIFLRQHPLVKTPHVAETQFFNQRYAKGVPAYLEIMPEVTDDEIVMEKTPAYFNFLPIDTPFRIKKVVPRAKIILVVCDPVRRFYSDYVHEKYIGGIWEKMEFDNLVKVYLDKYNTTIMRNIHSDSELFDYVTRIHKWDKPSHILTTGMYYYHLLRWVEVFGFENIYIMNGEDLLSQPGREFEQLQRYLGLPRMLIAEDFVRNELTGFFCFAPKWSENFKASTGIHHHTLCLGKSKGRTRNNSTAQAKSITDLHGFYRPFNEKFFKLIGRRMNWE